MQKCFLGSCNPDFLEPWWSLGSLHLKPWNSPGTLEPCDLAAVRPGNLEPQNPATLEPWNSQTVTLQLWNLATLILLFFKFRLVVYGSLQNFLPTQDQHNFPLLAVKARLCNVSQLYIMFSSGWFVGTRSFFFAPIARCTRRRCRRGSGCSNGGRNLCCRS